MKNRKSQTQTKRSKQNESFFFFFFFIGPVKSFNASGIPFFGDPGFFPEMKYTNQITMRIFDTVPSGLKEFVGEELLVFPDI